MHLKIFLSSPLPSGYYRQPLLQPQLTTTITTMLSVSTFQPSPPLWRQQLVLPRVLVLDLARQRWCRHHHRGELATPSGEAHQGQAVVLNCRGERVRLVVKEVDSLKAECWEVRKQVDHLLQMCPSPPPLPPPSMAPKSKAPCPPHCRRGRQEPRSRPHPPSQVQAPLHPPLHHHHHLCCRLPQKSSPLGQLDVVVREGT